MWSSWVLCTAASSWFALVHILATLQELKDQQAAIVAQMYELSRNSVQQQLLQQQQQQQQQQGPMPLGASHTVWGAYSALSFVALGAAAAVAILRVAQR